MAAAVVSCTSLVMVAVLQDVLPYIFSALYLLGFDTRSSTSLPTDCSTQYCVLSIISKNISQPQDNPVNPLAVLLLLRPRIILRFLHLSLIAGIRGAAAGICPPRRSGGAPVVCI